MATSFALKGHADLKGSKERQAGGNIVQFVWAVWASHKSKASP